MLRNVFLLSWLRPWALPRTGNRVDLSDDRTHEALLQLLLTKVDQTAAGASARGCSHARIKPAGLFGRNLLPSSDAKE